MNGLLPLRRFGREGVRQVGDNGPYVGAVEFFGEPAEPVIVRGGRVAVEDIGVL